MTHHPVHICLRKLGGNEHEGDYLVSTSYANGEPTACKVTLDWMDEGSHPSRAATLSTNSYGLAKVHLRFPSWTPKMNQYGYSSGFGLRLTARDREGRTSTFDDSVMAMDSDDIWITVAHTLLKPDQMIEATMHGPQGSTIDVEVLSDDGVLAHQQVRMRDAQEPFTVPADTRFHGLIALQAYCMTSDAQGYNWQRYVDYKTVLYPEDRELKVKLTGLQPSYLPGAEVNAGLAVHDPSGSPAPGALGVAVIDTAVEQRAATEDEANDHWFGWNWWQSDNNVGGVTRASLDRRKQQ